MGNCPLCRKEIEVVLKIYHNSVLCVVIEGRLEEKEEIHGDIVLRYDCPKCHKPLPFNTDDEVVAFLMG